MLLLTCNDKDKVYKKPIGKQTGDEIKIKYLNGGCET